MKNLITNAVLLTLPGSERPRCAGELGKVGLIRDGAVLMDGERIAAVGLKDLVMRHPDARKGRIFDAGGRVVMPGFADCHTHPVFGAPRLKDFELRARGKSYREIAAEGGGIVSSLAAVRGATEAELTRLLQEQAQRFLECGTTAIEAKSGYGLDKDSELKALRAIKHVAAGGRLDIVATFLGAHAVPPEYKGKPAAYVAMLIRDVLPAVAAERLAVYVDAFCEKGYFSPQESESFLAAGAAAGLRVKVHAEQLSRSGGAALAARLNAVSADHLDCADDGDLRLLKESGTIAVLVPGSNHFLGLTEYPPARRIIDSGVPVALATDFNPGTCPCWNMQEILSIAVSRMRMTPEETLAAATINGAHAMGLGQTHGSLETGKVADILVMDCRDYREIPYWFGANLVAAVFKRGKLLHHTVELQA
ncbi:MAG: imidazolonepropionase [Elusimicrobia bacterium GWA2_69_24]|nr:MAG: imidazolonepropionase [Elusimicrobia bacterium GWA2_69_24]HBL15259.1 imidazolonepropionase [Elusimicrobiota bacterium]